MNVRGRHCVQRRCDLWHNLLTKHKPGTYTKFLHSALNEKLKIAMHIFSRTFPENFISIENFQKKSINNFEENFISIGIFMPSP